MILCCFVCLFPCFVAFFTGFCPRGTRNSQFRQVWLGCSPSSGSCGCCSGASSDDQAHDWGDTTQSSRYHACHGPCAPKLSKVDKQEEMLLLWWHIILAVVANGYSSHRIWWLLLFHLHISRTQFANNPTKKQR